MSFCWAFLPLKPLISVHHSLSYPASFFASIRLDHYYHHHHHRVIINTVLICFCFIRFEGWRTLFAFSFLFLLFSLFSSSFLLSFSLFFTPFNSMPLPPLSLLFFIFVRRIQPFQLPFPVWPLFAHFRPTSTNSFSRPHNFRFILSPVHCLFHFLIHFALTTHKND